MTDHDQGPPDPSAATDLTGTLLSGRYQLDEQIGSGGMGTVWRATDTLLNRPVAVKLLHVAQMAEPTARERFRTEGRITAGLSHPGIAQVYDYGEQNDRAFLIMELVPGEPLSSILRRNEGGLDIGATLDIVGQAAAALAAAHARGVVHRDIKPGNLLVTEDGAVKLTDFGIARGDQSVTLTQTGMVMGTAQYISPEQASGRSATYSSDIYALGVVAYECLAGAPPFTSDTPLALALAHTREPPPPLPDHVPPPVRGLVERMLEKAPADRPGSAGEVAHVAQQLRGGPAAGAAATTAMNLADVDQTAVVAAGRGEPTTRPGATVPGRGDGAWSGDGDDSSDRLAGEPGPRRRPGLPVVLAAIAVAAVLVFGVVLAGRLWWAGSDPNGNTKKVNQERTPSASNEPSPSAPQEDQGGQNEGPAPGTGQQNDTPDQEETDGGEQTSPQPSTQPTSEPTTPEEPTGGPTGPGDGGQTPPPDGGGQDGDNGGGDSGQDSGDESGGGGPVDES